MRGKPIAANGRERLEEIRGILGLSMSEFSLAMGFKTAGGYSATLKNKVTDSHVLIGEGLLALRKPNGHAPAKHVLLEISHDGTVTSKPCTINEWILNGESFLVLKQEK